MRAELAAFRELDTLVRNLTDQLAGYRRRALSAESRVRELEFVAEELRGAIQVAESSVSISTNEVRQLREQLSSIPKSVAAASPNMAVATNTLIEQVAMPTVSANPANDKALVRENAELRSRLDEATLKVREIGDRLRFLRQQLTVVPEK